MLPEKNLRRWILQKEPAVYSAQGGNKINNPRELTSRRGLESDFIRPRKSTAGSSYSAAVEEEELDDQPLARRRMPNRQFRAGRSSAASDPSEKMPMVELMVLMSLFLISIPFSRTMLKTDTTQEGVSLLPLVFCRTSRSLWTSKIAGAWRPNTCFFLLDASPIMPI